MMKMMIINRDQPVKLQGVWTKVKHRAVQCAHVYASNGTEGASGPMPLTFLPETLSVITYLFSDFIRWTLPDVTVTKWR